MKRAYLRPPCPAYDVEAVESWLGDLAREGLVLSKDGFFCGFGFFDRTSPQMLRYRLEAAPKAHGLLSDGDGAPDAQQMELAGDFGWEYVARFGDFYIYRTSDPDAPELHSDPRVQAISIKMLRRRLRGNALMTLFWLVLYPLFGIHLQLLRTMLAAGTPFVLLGFGLGFWSFGRALAQAVHLRRLGRTLTRGQPLRHNKPWRAHALRHRLAGPLQIALLLAWAIWAVVLLGQEAGDERRVPLDGQAMPFATMADFAPGATYEPDGVLGDSGNSVWRRSDLLARDVVSYREHATLTCEDGSVYQGGLYVDYFETASPLLAKQLVRETLLQARWQNLWDGFTYDTFDLPPLPVDEAIGYYDIGTHFPNILLREGDTVVNVMFYQTGPDTIPLTVWAEAVAAAISQ